MICILLRLILELIPTEDGDLPDIGTPEINSGYDKSFFQADGVPQGPPAVGLETVTDIAALPYILTTARTKQLSAHDPTGGNDDGFTGDEDDSEFRTQFRNPGTDPKPDVPSFTVSGSSVVDPGGNVEIAYLTDPGAIWRFFLEPEPFTQEAVEDLWLLAWWNGDETPAVEAPVSEFFGSRFIEDAPRGCAEDPSDGS
ncbi:hypothetical protein ACFL4G_09905 [Thermodesulfobacteriota bacterium]